jgi:hypothetical protein
LRHFLVLAAAIDAADTRKGRKPPTTLGERHLAMLEELVALAAELRVCQGLLDVQRDRGVSLPASAIKP